MKGDSILAQIREVPSGAHDIQVRVKGKGLAKSEGPVLFTVEPIIKSTKPPSGSVGGNEA